MKNHAVRGFLFSRPRCRRSVYFGLVILAALLSVLSLHAQYVSPSNNVPMQRLGTTSVMALLAADVQPAIGTHRSFGWIGFLSQPLFLLLTWVHAHVVSNWGWSIVVLTVILNMALLPTRILALRSTRKMQRIQPQIQAIKEKYKKYKLGDPRQQEMQREIHELHRAEGVNMFGGCLPTLLTWPLLFAFYRMLSNVAVLGQAPWLWLSDLSAPDPYHILPMLLIVSMMWSQLLSPSPGMDPKQQKFLALVMPLIFGFTTWSYASGLALYWVSGSVLNAMQQLVLNRTIKGA